MVSSLLRIAQRYDRVEPWLTADDARDVSAARQIFGEHDVAGLDARHRAVADLDLRRARQRDRILASGRAVPVEHVARRRRAKRDAARRLHRRALAVGALDVPERFHRQRQLGDVRLAIRTAVHAPHLRHAGRPLSRTEAPSEATVRTGSRSRPSRLWIIQRAAETPGSPPPAART